MNPEEIKKYKETIEEFLEKMTMDDFSITEINLGETKKDSTETLVVNIELKEPQILIGQNGQTLLELQRLLKIILNKKTQNNFYLDLDINHYKNKKIDYLKYLAKDSANQVALTHQEKVLPVMSSYERRIIHSELADRQDVVTLSQGDEFNRYITISPR